MTNFVRAKERAQREVSRAVYLVMAFLGIIQTEHYTDGHVVTCTPASIIVCGRR